MGVFKTRRPLFRLLLHFISFSSMFFLLLNDVFTLIKIMFNPSSPQDQMSNFILNNAYSGQIVVKFTLKFRIKPPCYKNRVKYKLYNPFIEGIFDLIKKLFSV